MNKRPLDVCVISDIHLGTFGCQAQEVLNYLKSIEPKTLILNGDSKGTRVVYITGNHDEALRKYGHFEMGNIQLTDKIVFEINGEKNWVFHGDVFDRTTKGWAKLLAKLGGYGYDLLILINSSVNFLCSLFGREKMSLSKQVKNGVKKAVSWINNFEQTAAELAIDNGYKYVICGHIHQPQHRVVSNDKGSVTYLNSGDWIENLTALEYAEKGWTLYQYDPKQFEHIDSRKRIKVVHLQEELTVLTNEVAFQVSI